MKRILRWLIATLIVVLCLLVAFALFLTTSPGEDLIRSVAEARLTEALQQDVSIEKLETNLISRLRIRKLNISKQENGTEIPFVQLNELTVNYSLWQLILQNIYIPALQIDSLQLWVLKDCSGFYNLPVPAPSPEEAAESSPLNIALGTFILNHGTFHFQDQTVPMSGTLRNFNFQLRNQNSNRYDFALSAYGNDFKYENRAIPIDTLEIDGGWKDQELQVHSSLLTFPGYRLTGGAAVDLKPDSPEIRGKLQLKGSPQALSEIFHDYLPEQVHPIRGEVNLSVELNGNVDQPRIVARVDFPRLHLAETVLQKGIIEAEWYQQHVELKQFTLRIMEGEVYGSGRVEMGETLSHSVDFIVSNLDLARIWNALYRQPSPYQGKIDGSIRSGNPVGALDSLWLLADLSMQELRFRNAPLSDFIVRARVEQGRAILDMYQAESRIQANVRFTEEQLQGDFSIKIFRLEPLAGLFNLMALRGRVSVQGNVSGPTDSPSQRANFGAANIRYRNLPLDTLQGSLSFVDEEIIFGKCTFSSKTAEIDSTHPPFDLTGLQGGFSFQGEFEGSPDNPAGNFRLLFSDLRYADYAMDSLSVHLSASNNIIYLDELRVIRDSLAVVAEGEYSLLRSRGLARLGLFSEDIPSTPGDSDYQIVTTFDLSDSTHWKMDMTAAKLQLGKLALLIPEMEDIDGLLSFDLNFSGTPEKPRADLMFTIRAPRFQQVNMDSITGRIALKSDYLYLQKLELTAAENRSWFEGRVQLRKAGQKEYAFSKDNFISLSAEADDIDLRLFNPFLTSDMSIAGISSYRLEIEGSLNNPQINGELNLSRGEIHLGEGASPITSLEVDLSLVDSLLHIQQFRGEIRKTPFNLNGMVIAKESVSFTTDIQLSIQNTNVLRSVGTIDENEMDFDLSVNQFDISFLLPFLTGIENLSGTANADWGKPLCSAFSSAKAMSFRLFGSA